MAPHAALVTRSTRRALPVVAGVVVLTLLFAAQEIVRNVAGGGGAHVGRALLFNGIDWVTWGLLAPVILAAARQYPLDGRTSLAVRALAWLGVGTACCLFQSLSAGYLVFTFKLVTMPPVLGAAPSLAMFLPRWVVSTLALNILVFIMMVGLLHAALYYDDLRERRLRESDLRARLAQAELKVLRMQLQPHFLFNALHTVSSLMLSDVPQAHRVIAAIGDLLRWSIDHTATQEVPLRQEMEFADRYLEVQQARYRERMRVERDLAPECLDALVPSFILQPLLENAVRHGIEPSANGATIRVAASRSGNSLVLSVFDDAPEPQRTATAFAGNGNAPGGIGLTNLRSRLGQLYGHQQEFEASRQASGGFAVRITIPFHSDARLYPTSPLQPAGG